MNIVRLLSNIIRLSFGLALAMGVKFAITLNLLPNLCLPF